MYRLRSATKILKLFKISIFFKPCPFLAIALVSVLFLGGAIPVNAQQQPAFNPGEVLVKFAPGTSGSAATAKSGQTTPLDLAILKPEIDRLSEKTGVPLTISALHSGGWLVVSVDAAALNARLVRLLEDRAGVKSVQVASEPPPAPGVTVPPVLVHFEAGVPGTGLEDLGKELQSGLASPLTMETNETGALVIQIDVAALTLMLVEHLQALSEIEQAQPNYLMGIGIGG